MQNVGRNCARAVHFCPEVADLERALANFAQIWLNSSQRWPNLQNIGGNRAGTVQVRPKVVDFEREVATFAENWSKPKSPKSTDSGLKSIDVQTLRSAPRLEFGPPTSRGGGVASMQSQARAKPPRRNQGQNLGRRLPCPGPIPSLGRVWAANSIGAPKRWVERMGPRSGGKVSRNMPRIGLPKLRFGRTSAHTALSDAAELTA